MAQGNEKEIEDVLEDLDLHKFLYEDMLQTRADDSMGIAESLNTIKTLEAKLARLLGEAPPISPQSSVSSVAPEQNPPATPTRHATNETRSTAPSSQNVTPNRRGDSRPGLSPHSLAPPPGADLYRNLSSAPHWPSSAPSPFVTASRHPPQHDLSIPSDASRKRPRQDSRGTLSQPEPSKRTLVSKSKSRMEEIDAEMNTQLARNREIHDDSRCPENIRQRARDENLSEDQVKSKIDQEQKDMEDLIKTQFQYERDGELARMLQAQEEPFEDQSNVNLLPQASGPASFTQHPTLSSQPSFSPVFLSESRPSYTLPDRTQPAPALYVPQYKMLQSGRTSQSPMIKAERATSGSDANLSSWGSQPAKSTSIKTEPYDLTKSEPNPTYSTGRAFENDDDLQEISPADFNSRFSGRPRLGAPPMPLPPPCRQLPWMPSPTPMPPPGRQLPWMAPPMPMRPSDSYLPWMQDPWGGNADAAERVMDLIQRQEDLDMFRERYFDEDEDDLAIYEEANFPQDIQNLLTGIKDIREATKADKDDTPISLKVTLMKHQKIGLAWMKAKEESSQKGGILADDMGLGKTIQAIALITARPPTDPERHPCLIVCPKALMDQWRLEIQRHIHPGRHRLSVFIFHEKKMHWRALKGYDVVITTFGTLTANYKHLKRAEDLEKEGRDVSIVRKEREQACLFLPASKWHRVIVDEAQNIKNPLAKSAKACCQLDAKYRWCLTGTPMMNRLEDFQSLLLFLRIRPYNNKEKFKRSFVQPLKHTGAEQAMQQLRVLVKSVCLRRTKESKIDGQPILQLPPKVIEKVHVVFSETEDQLYQGLSTKTQNQVTRMIEAGELGRNYSHVLVLLLRLRQACCHPLLMQGFNNELPTTIEDVDLVANARLLSDTVVSRIKNNEGEDDGTCPICMDTVENAVIYIPCGHSVCSECFARISDPLVLARDDTSGMIKCQNCRGQVDPLKITDGTSFKKAHETDSTTESVAAAAAAEDTEQSTESDSDDDDSDTETDGSGTRPKKMSLAELRKEGFKNIRAKKRYLRRLEKTWIPSSKTEKAMEILQSVEDRGKNEKTIIFSQFTSLLDLVEVPIDRRGWKYVRFDGTMKTSDRNDAVAAFTDDPDVKIMLVSLKAGNSGLNLVAATHVILFDPFWNPYVEDQAIDRAHRIGQPNEVFVHRLLIQGTVEDRIIDLQEKKRELIGGALDEGGSLNISRLDVRELAYLFGVRA